MRNYSQNNEQEIILNHFRERATPGRFLDIGAYNGPDLSNTYALLELGWSGVLVEPNPYNLVQLMESTRKFGKRASIVACAIGDPTPCLQRLRLDDAAARGRGWAASLVESNPGVMEESPTALYVPVFDVEAVKGFGPFDFISIDAEWMDAVILEQFTPDDLVICRMLIIEPGGPDGASTRDSMKASLRTKGFNPDIYATPENVIAIK